MGRAKRRDDELVSRWRSGCFGAVDEHFSESIRHRKVSLIFAEDNNACWGAAPGAFDPREQRSGGREKYFASFPITLVRLQLHSNGFR